MTPDKHVLNIQETKENIQLCNIHCMCEYCIPADNELFKIYIYVV